MVVPLSSVSTKGSPLLFSAGKPGTASTVPKPVKSGASATVVRITNSPGPNVAAGSTAGVPPSEIVQPPSSKNLSGVALCNSMNSASGSPTTGVGSAISSLIVTSRNCATSGTK